MKTICIEGIHIDIERRMMRSMRLSVRRDGRVMLRIPLFLPEATARAFILQKWSWICRTRDNILRRERLKQAEYIAGEQHYLFGKPYTLQILYITSGAGSVCMQDDTILMSCRPTATAEKRKELLLEFYRSQLRTMLVTLMEQWTAKLSEPDVTWTIRLMRAEWGSCTKQKRHLLFNLELARVPVAYIEYVVVHELTHLAVANHGPAFKFLMTQRLPDWRQLRKQLNAYHSNLQ